jgi:hypothetical protein
MRTHLHIITWDIPRSKPEAAGVRPKIPVKFCNEGREDARSVNWGSSAADDAEGGAWQRRRGWNESLYDWGDTLGTWHG